jgi:hypothetical protein
MTVMGEASRERRPIVEGVWLSTSGQLDLPLEGFDFSPSLEHSLLFFWKIDRHICGVYCCR